MKTKLALFATLVLLIVACHTTKKTTTTVNQASSIDAAATKSTTTATTNVTETTSTVAIVKSIKTSDGVYDPGQEELLAIQPQYKDATMGQLKEGYSLYAQSACISCHNPVNIYTFPSFKWPMVLNDMAYRAKLTPTQKESVTRYVYAILAANPNKK